MLTGCRDRAICHQGSKWAAHHRREHRPHAEEDTSTDDFCIGRKRRNPFAEVMQIGKTYAEEPPKHAAEKKSRGEKAARAA